MAELFFVENNEFNIGRENSCHVVCADIEEMSARHLRIYSQNKSFQCQMLGRNGGYINGKFIRHKEMVPIKFGDEIELFSVRIIWLEDLVAIECSESIDIMLSGYYEETSGDDGADEVVSKAQYFTKAPRTFYSLCNEVVELEAPPEKHVEENQSMLTTIGPACTMAIPMVLGFSISKISSGQDGMSHAFMYTGLITAICSAAFGVMWALMNIKNRRSQASLAEKKRKAAYVRYVRESEAKIRSLYNRNVSNLRLMYPEIHEYVPDGINRFLLWNRSLGDTDCLKVRLGTGNIPYDISISIPKDRFSIIEDELKNLPKHLKNTYSTLRDVPETLDLNENRCVGIVSDSRQIREDAFLEILIMLAVSLSPDELHVILHITKETIDKDCLRAVRFLPHIDRAQGRTSSNSKKTVVFTDDYEQAFTEYAEVSDVSYIVISSRFEFLPAECRFIIQREQHFSGYLQISNSNSIRRNVHFDRISLEEAEHIARVLQGVKLKCHYEGGNIPEKVSFLELYKGEITCSAILANWEESSCINSINAMVGMIQDKKILSLNFHEKGVGPHGLIAGMTGSGKSEILQTIILSLSVMYSPEDIGFFLIDYKGGGMSKLFDGIPHVLGSISNLSGRMISRAMASVKSENERRQNVFNETGVNNISQYHRRYKLGEVKEPLPHVFIIVDEFAELKREEPEFMKELISVARVGRSLGVHLILATQKPAGVVDDNIFSNSRFRICLRVQDRSDSMEMLKKPDAADIVNPGRAILQVGNDEIYQEFQSAYTMDLGSPLTKRKYIRISDEKGRNYERSENVKEEEKKEPQIQRVVTAIKEAKAKYTYNRGRPLWLQPLGHEIYNSKSDLNANAITACCKERFDICIGLFDDPTHQRQGELSVNLVNTGHILILGGLQSGKSTMLSTILYELISNISKDFYNFYIVDLSSGRLKVFAGSVMTGGFIGEENIHDFEKLIILLKNIVSERKEVLSGGNYRQYIEEKSYESEGYIPPVIVIIDGLGSLREQTSGAFDKELENMLKISESLGIFIIATALNVSSSEVPRRMCDCFKLCIPLRLKDKYEYKEALNIQGSDINVPEEVSGRGLIRIDTGVVEFQTYQTCKAKDDFERGDRLTEIVDKWNKDLLSAIGTLVDETSFVKRLPIIPKDMGIESFIDELMKRGKKAGACKLGIPVGYFKSSGEIYYLPIVDGLIILISGREGSGKTNLLRIIEYMARRESDDIGIQIEEDCRAAYQAEEAIQIVGFTNGMKVIIYDESMSFSLLADIKKQAGNDPYVIHLGGALDRQNIADYSYIPYSQQIKVLKPLEGIVRKTLKGYSDGEIIIPEINLS